MNDNLTPPQTLRDVAYSDGEEYAWDAANAIRAIDWAVENRLAVLGGEVWLATNPGPTIPTPFFYEWSTERAIDESWDSFVDRCGHEARNCVRTFEWDENDHAHALCVPFFNLLLADDACA
ncbi:MAG: Imm40 family immunity protein [Pirellulales bacterium]